MLLDLVSCARLQEASVTQFITIQCKGVLIHFCLRFDVRIGTFKNQNYYFDIIYLNKYLNS